MPFKPLKPCCTPGCPHLVSEGAYCVQHKREQRNRLDLRRESSSARGYGSAWQKASKAFLKAHPLCECDECKAGPTVMASSVVDHITPHRGDMTLFWDRLNWRAMSKLHHDRKTAREDGGFGNRSSNGARSA